MTSKRLTNQTIFIPIGLPCAGKSSLFRCLSEMSGIGENLALVSPDEIREEIYPGYSAGLIPFKDIDNAEIFPRAYARMERHIIDGWDVWFDAINSNRGSMLMVFGRAEMVRRNPNFSGGDLSYIVILLDVPIDVIISRNEASRVGHRRPPRGALQRMWDERSPNPITLPTESFELWHLVWDGEWKMADDFEPSAICVDLVEAVNGKFSGKRVKRAP